MVIIIIGLAACTGPADSFRVDSPDGQLSLIFELNESGIPVFNLMHKEVNIPIGGELGLELEKFSFHEGLHIESISNETPVYENYTMVHGKQRDISYEARERVVTLKNDEGKLLEVQMRLSNDGLAFRYILPNVDGESLRITDELSQYRFGEDTKMWIQPVSAPKSGWRRTNPSYEEAYLQGTPITTQSEIGYGWVYPALLQAGDGWVLLSETGPERQYAATRLKTVPGENALKVSMPPTEETIMGGDHLPNASGELRSPWRLIAVGTLETIVGSTMGTDLAKPAVDVAGEVQPGYASWSWALLKDNSVVYDVQKQFIDYAADMNWQYCLVDVNWDRNIGYERIAELAAYADSKEVGLILWYNSSGEWNDTDYSPKSQLLTPEARKAEFQRIRSLGVKGVKIDFFGGDGQSVIAYYEDMLNDAAEAGLMVNFHGATLPRGWQRTYPNLLTVEAVKGFEFITFTQDVADQAAEHAATLPFTRNVFDPMDFTPMAFSEIPGIQKRTTWGFELALPTLFLSGIQHLAEVPEGMDAMPDFVKEYLSSLPTFWEESRLVMGFPGREVVIARRNGSDWYISGINGELEEKNIELDLSDWSGYSGMIIKDNASADDLVLTELTAVPGSKINVNLQPNGGFVIKLSKK